MKLKISSFYKNWFYFSIVLVIFIFVLTYIIGLQVSNQHFNFQSISQLHAANPFLWLLYIVSAGIIYMGYYLEQHNNKLYQKEKEKEELHENQEIALNFARELAEDNLDVSYSLENNDELGKVLVNLRNRLKKNKEEAHQRKKEDEQRNWISEGLAKFSDILRSDKNQDLNEMAYDIISNLVQYLDANQGGLFILNNNKYDQGDEINDDSKHNNDRHFELAAAYAYNRRKYHEKRVEWGEGLIGACALEKQTIYMTDIPDEYITITSGLGYANPRSLLIVPLKIEDRIYGIIELASFNEIEKYQREFVERIGENVASTISSIKINNRTNELLRKSQQQAEELASQEEELRQNMEEMKATQESLEQTQAKTKMIFENAMDAIVTIDEYGMIDQFSPSAEKLFGYKAEEVTGENVKILMPQEYSRNHDQHLETYRKTGEKHIIGKAREEKGQTKDGKVFPIEIRVEEAWLNDKRMFVGMLRDITDKKKAEEEVQQQMEEIRSQDEELRQNMEELKATQESLQEKEKKQAEIIKQLNADNEKKIEEIKRIQQEQKKKDEEIKKLYEGEINEMFETWSNHLNAIEKLKTNQ